MHSSWLEKVFFLFHSPTSDEFAASGAFFEYFFFVAPLSLKGEGVGFLVVVIANSFHFFFEDSFPLSEAEKPQAPPPLTHLNIYKKKALNKILI